MTVRHYDQTDFPAICRIYLDAKRDELKSELGVFDFTALDKDAVTLAAFEESDVIVYENESVEGFAATFDGQLRALFVHSEARGKGIGQALLSTVLACASEGLSLHVAKSNSGAIRFYEKNGFSIVAETTRKYSGMNVIYAKMSRLAR